MSVLLALEVFAGYFFLAALSTLFLFATYDWWRDANARHRIRKLVDAELAGRLAEDQQVAWLDAAWDLPTREPRA